MSDDKLKSKLSSIFLPKSTFSAENMSTSTSTSTRDPAVGSLLQRSRATSGPYRAPIIFSDRDRLQRKQQTKESEEAHAELLRHGIKVRDFQEEADGEARAHDSTGNSVTVDHRQAQEPAGDGGCRSDQKATGEPEI
ncbi:hypothetical protein ABEF95_015282 [Exophiala dermatitidis]